VIELETLRPYIGKYDGKYFQAAKSAMTKAFGIEPAFTREGGSIGAVLSMNEVLGVPVVFLGLSLPEHGYHAINENFDWQQASGGMKMFVEYFSEVAKMK
jgi:acetylornithine deacetylase/succinyl-diaminopimelate desuccinylase-like protein